MPTFELYINGVILYEDFCFWFLPLNIKIVKFFHVVAYSGKCLFILIALEYFVISIYSVDRYLGVVFSLGPLLTALL